MNRGYRSARSRISHLSATSRRVEAIDAGPGARILPDRGAPRAIRTRNKSPFAEVGRFLSRGGLGDGTKIAGRTTRSKGMVVSLRTSSSAEVRARVDARNALAW